MDKIIFGIDIGGIGITYKHILDSMGFLYI